MFVLASCCLRLSAPLLVVAVVAWALADPARATAPGPQADSYQLQAVGQAQVLDDMQRCLGAPARATQVQDFVARMLDETALVDPMQAAQLTTPGGKGVVLAAAGVWTCVKLSQEGFPQWPLEAMHGLIVPVGVPAQLTRQWRRQLLAQVARDGVGRGLIVYPGGDADQVHVIAEQRQALQIKVSLRMLSAGSYREAHYGAVLKHPGLSRLVTRSVGSETGTPWRMAIPPHRLQQPVRDGFVVLPATPLTRQFSFAGTQWQLGGEVGVVTLRADGQLAASGVETRTSTRKSHAALGQWRVADGVLQLSLGDGTRYALTLRDNPHLLVGMGRRADASDAEDEGGESQWPAQLQRHGVGDGAQQPHKQQA